MWRVRRRDGWILTMMRGIIVVVVGQEPLVIHVAPDGDDIPWQSSVAPLRTHFRIAHEGSRTVSHTATRLACGGLAERGTFLTVPSATRYYEFLSSASLREGRKHAFSRCPPPFRFFFLSHRGESRVGFRGTLSRAARTSDPELDSKPKS